MMRALPARGAALAGAALLLGACASAPRDAVPATVAGPPRGALVIVGGGQIGPEVMDRFIELAGGTAARIVIMPGAGTEDSFPDDWSGYRAFRNAGVQDVRVLHTRDRDVANSARFVEPLRRATGLWIPGGRQWRLVDSYLGTRTVDEVHALLSRGGVVGGTSAGASIQSSYMARGAREGNQAIIAPGYEEGFGLLRDAAVDQHLTARGRQEEMLEVVARYPHLLGIGIDEGTALIVRGDRAEVVGRGRIAFYNTGDRDGQRYYFLESGSLFDLAGRRTLRGRKVAPDTPAEERAVLAVMNRFFEALRQRDTTAVRAVMHPEARIFVPLVQGDTFAVRFRAVADDVRNLAASAERWDERAYQPEVRVDGTLATIWTYYEFWRDDAFSHCGTDALQLARAQAGWQVVALSYTVQRDGCRRVPRG